MEETSEARNQSEVSPTHFDQTLGFKAEPSTVIVSEQKKETIQESTSVSSQKIEDGKKPTKEEDFFAGPPKNLQDQFSKFRDKRVHKNKEMIELKKQSALRRTDPDFKAKLRAKFVERARHYFGVPYAKKFHKEGSEMYNSKLFLDCCGLVRRIVYDLRDDFGFTLGWFNQNYQFETLPIKLELHQMKPGDLIFYTGTYYPDKKLKKQIHKLVHVEIFTGGTTGEGSIGARYSTGIVKEFDSFKFQSTNYYDVEHHYRSIDTWLDGVCK